MKSTISRDSQGLISSQLPKSRWIRPAAVQMDVSFLVMHCQYSLTGSNSEPGVAAHAEIPVYRVITVSL